jgi:outer membrane protein insertion porin family
MRRVRQTLLVVAVCLGWSVVPAAGQQAPPQTPPSPKPAAESAQPPARLPPAGSPPLLRYVQLDFPTQGGVSVIDPETYLYYIRCAEAVSRPSDGVWHPYDEQMVLDDFRRLWNTKFLDNLWVEVKDAPYDNGVMGKHVIFNLEERQRVKIVDYVGSKKLEQTKIDEKLKEENAQIRLDSFIDQSLVKKVKGIILSMLGEKGYQYATVTPEVKELQGGPKLVHLTFRIDEGPKVKIHEVLLDGNKEISDFALRRQLKTNKAPWFLSFILGRATYQETKFEEDAQNVITYYRDRGYIASRVGDPELKVVEDSLDKRTRWVQLRIPIQEGPRFRVGTVEFTGNTVLKTEALQAIFAKVKPGKYYSEKKVRKAYEQAREVYGSVGYMEFTFVPDLKPRTEEPAEGGGTPPAAGEAIGPPAAASPPTPAAPATAKKPSTQVAGGTAAPIVDVTMRITEGKQYFVNRIYFTGNSTTRDNVVRREMQLAEGGVFNTEALKYSVKRINQLAYFKQLEGDKDVAIDKTPGVDNKVDVTLKFQEQNRNQITFGAGISQYEGFFGQLMFQTSNFMGRGETFSVSLQAGSRAQNYQIGFSEPFLFDRNITGGVDVFRRQLKYVGAFTQRSSGANVVFGFPLRQWTRMFLTYSYERARVTDIADAYLDPSLAQYNPYLADALLLTRGGYRTISKITPSVVYNTVDNPIFPTTGRRYTVSMDLAGIGGNTNFYAPVAEGVWYFKHTNRTSLGLRAQFGYIAPFKGSSETLPIYQLLTLGGEYSIRGFDIRSIGPKAAPYYAAPTYNGSPFLPGFVGSETSLEPALTLSDLVIGGNKSLLFNAEYLIAIAGQFRLVTFFDTGQARGAGDQFRWDEFKASTGLEVRFMMPVLNVPFRLIGAYNPLRSGVLNNNYEPTKKFTFKFAVGSTF